MATVAGLAHGLQCSTRAMERNPEIARNNHPFAAERTAPWTSGEGSGDARDLHEDRWRRLVPMIFVALALCVTIGSSVHARGEDDPVAERMKIEEDFKMQRERMVDEQLVARDITQPEVLKAMREVPRHRFMPEDQWPRAYEDRPLPIGRNQTISQPYIVALMTQLLDLDSTDRVLEVGTGSGYHAAVLSRVAGRVFSIEIDEALGRQAKGRLDSLGFDKIELRIDDGYRGWPKEALFDAIILTAAPPRIPQPLLDQLEVGGRMILPLGKSVQTLMLVTRTETGFEQRRITAVRFVPMTGQVQQRGR